MEERPTPLYQTMSEPSTPLISKPDKQPHSSMVFWTVGALYGASAVCLGAFGSHGLKKRIADPSKIANWNTAAHYQVCQSPRKRDCTLKVHSWCTPVCYCSPRPRRRRTRYVRLIKAGLSLTCTRLRHICSRRAVSVLLRRRQELLGLSLNRAWAINEFGSQSDSRGTVV